MTQKRQSQVIDIKKEFGFTTKGESNEILRNSSKGAYEAKLSNAFDPTREHLNFEVKDGKIVPLDKNSPIGTRIRRNLRLRGIHDPNEGKDKPTRRTLASIILGGSQIRMRELAFGSQTVKYEKGADNSAITRQKEIEDWALDAYKFVANEFGEENIAAFVVHLDETNPHVHCKVIPVDKESNKISWRKVMVGKVNTKWEYSKNMRRLQDEYAKQVSNKYGLERGEPISETNAKHRTTEEYHVERRKKLKEEVENLELEKAAKLDELENLDHDIKHARARVRGLQTMIHNLEEQIVLLQKEIADLEADRDAGRISADEANERLQKLQRILDNATVKLEDKNEKLREAEKLLAEVQKQVADKQKESDVLKQKISADLPLVKRQIFSDMQNIGFENAVTSVKNFFQKYDKALQEADSELREGIEETVSPLLDNSLFKDIVENAAQIAQVSSYLFLGYLDKATQAAESCGGGGGCPETGWGKRDDEDEWAFKHRCYLMGMKMVKTPKQERKREIKI